MAIEAIPTFSIRLATNPSDMASVADCFQAYTKWLNIDLTFQDYAAELSTLPGKYTSPKGALLLACDLETNQVLGCIAMSPIELQAAYKANRKPHTRYCELKRLYVYPAARGRNVARALVAEVLLLAQKESYDEALLDTLESMTAAISLYKSLGFVEVESYYENPDDGFINMSKKIQPE